MARARSPTSLEAEKLYDHGNGLKLVEIAEKLKVPDGTVRRWKNTYDWDGKAKKKESERSEKIPNVRNKGGAPKGSRNAIGHGAPEGNQNALKHGAYSKVYWDTLDDDEKELIDDMPTDEEEILIGQIQLFTVRERRIMQAINKYRKQKEPVALYGVMRTEDKRTFADEEEKQLYNEAVERKVMSGDRLPGEKYTLQTQTENKDNLIARLEKELTSVQNAKNRAVDSLIKLRMERQKLAGENKGNEAVRSWVNAVLKARGDSNG